MFFLASCMCSMYVLCLEGCHGSGKTSVLELAQKQNCHTFDENYVTMPDSALHPQSLTCEITWVVAWFKRILQVHSQNPNLDTLFISDRSPFSAVFYAKNGALLLPIIQHQIKELNDIGVYVETVYLQVNSNELWNRIKSRLEKQPFRTRYCEHKKSWMEDTVKWYESQSWTHTLNSTDMSPNEVFNALCDFVGGR